MIAAVYGGKYRTRARLVIIFPQHGISRLSVSLDSYSRVTHIPRSGLLLYRM